MSRCESCQYCRMCYLHKEYMNVISFVALLTDTREPRYSQCCRIISEILYSCIYYEEKKDA